MAIEGISAAVEVRNAIKVYGAGERAVTALNDVSLEIGDNEFFTLLGPSGCGKTTMLRLIAGFEELTQGEIRLYGEELAALPPNKRPVNTVFQHYALFPHMSVADNIAFGLQRLGHAAPEVKRRVGEMLDLVQLSDLAARRPSQLSGGQQQRVALARALAPHPKVLLLDEPLSALDLKLRQAMRIELKQLQEDTGITFIFVTHDQEEALTMSDRIAVMSAGLVQQIGSAAQIYEAPINRFVADFIGDTNLIDVTVESLTADGTVTCRAEQGLQLTCDKVGDPDVGQMAHVSIRPEKLSLIPRDQGDAQITCEVQRLVYLGTDTQYLVSLGKDLDLRVRVQNAHDSGLAFGPGDIAGLKLDAGAARLLTD